MTPLRGRPCALRAGKIGLRPGRAGYYRGMGVLVLVLLIAAAVCFGIAAANVATRVNLVALGLLFWVLTAAIPALGGAA